MKKKIGILIVTTGIYLLIATGIAFAAEWANPELLVTPEEVEKNIDKPDWVVIDARELKDYAKGHIPGAISLGKRVKKALRDSTSTKSGSALATFTTHLWIIRPRQCFW